jgi:hypothetical protein
MGDISWTPTRNGGVKSAKPPKRAPPKSATSSAGGRRGGDDDLASENVRSWRKATCWLLTGGQERSSNGSYGIFRPQIIQP